MRVLRSRTRLALNRAAQPIAFGCLLAALLVLLSPVLTRAVGVWQDNADLDFGFAIPPTALALVWWHRSALRSCAVRGTAAGLGIAAVAVLGLVVSERLWARSPAAISAGLLVFGMVVFVWGWIPARILAFPIGLVTAGLAMQPTLLSGLGFALQGITAVGAAESAQMLGLPIVREGLLLRAPSYSFIVSEACSGMNSLIALLLIAILWIYLVRGAAIGRAAIVLAVLPLVIVANTTRVSLVLLVADRFGQDAALGFFHGASSFVLFGLALLGLLLVTRMVECRVPRAA
jgi:exosortase